MTTSLGQVLLTHLFNKFIVIYFTKQCSNAKNTEQKNYTITRTRCWYLAMKQWRNVVRVTTKLTNTVSTVDGLNFATGSGSNGIGGALYANRTSWVATTVLSLREGVSCLRQAGARLGPSVSGTTVSHYCSVDTSRAAAHAEIATRRRSWRIIVVTCTPRSTPPPRTASPRLLMHIHVPSPDFRWNCCTNSRENNSLRTV